jgi:hypothetical protein
MTRQRLPFAENAYQSRRKASHDNDALMTRASNWWPRRRRREGR